MTNYFKGVGEDGDFSGLNLILGSYSIHFLEGESSLVMKILTSLNEYSQQPSNPY